MKPFCEQLSEARKLKGMTQDSLASEMNITRQGVSRWENGKSLPDAETLKRLSQVLSYDFVADECILPAQNTASVSELPIASVKAASRTSKTVLLCALCLVVGLAAGALIGYFALPHNASSNAASMPNGAQRQALHQESFKPEVQGEAFLRITAAENPVKAVRMSDGSAMWQYTFIIKNVGELSFTADKVEQRLFTDDGVVCPLAATSAADMCWGDGVILPGCEVTFGGGFPVQPLTAVHVTVYGTDADGKDMSFEGEVSLVKEIAE